MTYLVYATNQEAAADEALIVANIAAVIASVFPERYSNGELISVDAAGQLRLSAARTTRWDVPRQCAEGWAIVKPTQDMIGRVPLDAAMTGVGGAQYESVTWPVIELP